CTSFSYVLLRLTQGHRQLSSAPGTPQPVRKPPEPGCETEGGEAGDIHPERPRELGDKVIRARGVAKAFGNRILFENLEFSLPPNGIVGVIGPNGAGKTTLFRMIMKQETVDNGSTFEVGGTVTLGYVDQAHADIDPKKSVYEVISGGVDEVMVGNRPVNARALCCKIQLHRG
ncbi:MAG: ATP-binding cassette domain-containing protein, partial [Marinilabiliales bacterium]|nr:ATP-binding cassette domain-containing protein [Marinilabiliales bacterium]